MSEDERKKLGERLREAREYVGLSQEQVAEQLKVPRPAISLMETGSRKVEAIELAALAKLYNRPTDYFTGGASGVAREPPQLELLKRTAAKLSTKDREEVIRFAEYLRDRSRSKQ